LKELVKSWHVDEVTIAGLPFCGLKGIGEKDHGDMTQNPTDVKIT